MHQSQVRDLLTRQKAFCQNQIPIGRHLAADDYECIVPVRRDRPILGLAILRGLYDVGSSCEKYQAANLPVAPCKTPRISELAPDNKSYKSDDSPPSAGAANHPPIWGISDADHV